MGIPGSCGLGRLDGWESGPSLGRGDGFNGGWLKGWSGGGEDDHAVGTPGACKLGWLGSWADDLLLS